MKIVLFLPLLALLSGCYGVRDAVVTEPLVVQEPKTKGFHTDMSHFSSEFSQVKTKDARNKLIEELITASNMECSAYLYHTTSEPEESVDNGYMAMFKIVGKYIGWDIAKDAISAVSILSDNVTKKSNQDQYAQALKPNIIKAVQISREKYLQKIEKSKALQIKAYSLEDVKEDIQNYDKRCATYYGLMEITRALQNQQSVSKKEAKIIDVEEVKVKIKEVTKAVLAKRVWKENNCTISQEFNSSK